MRTVAPVLLVIVAAGCAGGPSITDVAGASGISVGGVDSRVITGAAKTVAALNTHIETGDEIRIGRAAAARILGRYGRWADAKRTEYVNLVGQGLVQSVGREDLTYYFALLDTDEVVALSCPGGYVFISRGTLRLMKDEAELAAVLGHEIAHINERHVLREIEKRYVVDAAAGTAMAAASSDSATIGAIRMGGPAFSKLADFAVGVVFKGYNRKQESAADKAAVEYAYRVGYDPGGMRRFVQAAQGHGRNRGKPKPGGLLSTHPVHSTRIADLRRQVNAMGGSGGRPALKKRFMSSTRPLK